MRNEIKRFAEENELVIGICGAEKWPEPSGGDRPFPSAGDQSAIGNPRLFLPGAQSILVAGINLYKKTEIFPNDGVPRGRLSFVALGTDYHRLLREKLTALAGILSRHKSFQYKIHVDTGPLPEKDFAVAAGLGFKGKNSLVISPRFGSYFAIGLLVLNMTLEETADLSLDGCGACTRCIDACPTAALEMGKLNWRRCISYLTQSKTLSVEQEFLLRNSNAGNYLYGCDCCQLACPYNHGLAEAETIRIETAYPALRPLLHMSGKEWKERFGSTAAGWRISCVKRNVEICLKNMEMGET